MPDRKKPVPLVVNHSQLTKHARAVLDTHTVAVHPWMARPDGSLGSRRHPQPQARNVRRIGTCTKFRINHNKLPVVSCNPSPPPGMHIMYIHPHSTRQLFIESDRPSRLRRFTLSPQ